MNRAWAFHHHPLTLGWDAHTSVTWGPHLCREMPERLPLIHLGKLIRGSVSSEHLENKDKGLTHQPSCCILEIHVGFSEASLESITIITYLSNTLLGKLRPQHENENTCLLIVLSKPSVGGVCDPEWRGIGLLSPLLGASKYAACRCP